MRKIKDQLNTCKVYFGMGFTSLCFFAILIHIFIKGIGGINYTFLFGTGVREGESLVPMMVTTVIIIVFTLLIAVPVGIGSAIFLNEYAKPGSKVVSVIRIAVETLSGIPSIIYGLFGFIFFVLTLKWSWSILAGILTLSIMVLPTIIRSSEEALKTVEGGYREGSYALGAGKFATIFKVVLPSCITGILAAVILSIGRIVGETAALILTAGTIVNLPNIFQKGGFFSSASTLSVYMYTLTTEGMDFEKAYATAIVLMVIVLSINLLANFIASKLKRG